jgi:hypothetical protein
MLGVGPPRPEQLPHVVAVEREGVVGRDDSGFPVEAWAAVAGYDRLPAFVAPAGAEDLREFDQMGIQASHKIYLGPLRTGGLPQILERDRIVFGTRPDGGARVFKVQARQDEGELGVLLTVYALERVPGA